MPVEEPYEATNVTSQRRDLAGLSSPVVRRTHICIVFSSNVDVGSISLTTIRSTPAHIGLHLHVVMDPPTPFLTPQESYVRYTSINTAHLIELLLILLAIGIVLSLILNALRRNQMRTEGTLGGTAAPPPELEMNGPAG